MFSWVPEQDGVVGMAALMPAKRLTRKVLSIVGVVEQSKDCVGGRRYWGWSLGIMID